MEEEEDEEDEEELEVSEITIDGTIYYTDDNCNGSVYEYLDDGDIGEIIGQLQNKQLFLY